MGLSILNREVSKFGERMGANAEYKVWSDLKDALSVTSGEYI